MESAYISAKKSYGKSANIPASASLITMEGTKLKLMPGLELPNPSVRVVSIVGKARMGKSTFLNAIVSKYTQENSAIFATNGGVKHCTFGINYCYIPDQNLLLLDSQGLANGDARHDPALLLFIYLVSNVVIFNDTKILQNEALKLIEPICTFATYIDYDTFVKPSLIFRLSDGKLVENTDENLNQVMESHPDQYQSIRDSIEEVFDKPIRLVKTETIDRKEERFLDSGDYLSLLMEKDNGFDATISAIMELVKKSEPRANILNKLPEIVEQINNNEKITLEKLDVVGLVHKNDVLEWLQTVSPHLKTPIQVDGTEVCFQERVVKRQQEVDAKLKEFDKRFKSVSATIKKEQKKKLKAELEEPILKATEDSKEKATLKVKAIVDGLEQYKCSMTSSGFSFSKLGADALGKEHLSKFQHLKDACSTIFGPIRGFYESWVKGVNDDFKKTVEECREQEQAERALVQKFCNDTLENYEAWTIENISGLTDVLITNDQFMNNCRSNRVAAVTNFINDTVTVRKVSLSMQSNRLSPKIDIISKVNSPNTYDLVADIYESFVTGLTAKEQGGGGDDLKSLITDKKEALLKNKLFTNPVLQKQLYLKNPEMVFVYDSFLLDVMVLDGDGSFAQHKLPYMTEATWYSVYEPLYNEAFNELIKEGVCAEGSNFKKFVIKSDTDVSAGGLSDFVTVAALDKVYSDYNMYDTNVVELLENKLRMLYCKKIVSGFEFPVFCDSL